MLFALSFDKLVFGHTPDLLSIAGSTLILGSAMYVALQGNGAAKSKEQAHGNVEIDGESQQRLMSGVHEERTSLEGVQMRVLR